MGSQQARYKQTPQSCLELRTVGCDWKRRGDWTTLTQLKTLLDTKHFNFFQSKNCTKDYLMHKLKSFQKFWDQPFSSYTIWRSDFFSVLSLSLHSSCQGQRFFSLITCMSVFGDDQKVIGGLLIFTSILFGYAGNCHSKAFQRGAWFLAVSDWDSNPRLRFNGPRC